MTQVIADALFGELKRRREALAALPDLKTVRLTVVLNPKTGQVVKVLTHLETESGERRET